MYFPRLCIKCHTVSCVQAARQEEALARLANVMNEVSRCSPSNANALTLSGVEAVYSGLIKLYREDYIMYNLSAAALSHALPLFVAHMKNWQPLLQPSHGAAEFARWRPLLDPQGSGSSTGGSLFGSGGFGGDASSSQEPYTALVSDVVLPPLRAATTSWEPRDPEPLLTFLETWEPLLPRAALSHILDMLVMPRLRRAVGEWEPVKESVPIHAWLHPWLPYLGTALTELYPSIRQKLSKALEVGGVLVKDLGIVACCLDI